MRRYGGSKCPASGNSHQRWLTIVAATALAGQFDANFAAAQPLEPAQPKYGWREVWSGADATRDVWLLYGGVTLAPFSEHIYGIA